MTRKNTKAAESATLVTEKHTVLAFVKMRESAGEIGGASGKTYFTAAAKLSEFLGRPALLKDLSESTLSSFHEWLKVTALKDVSIINYLSTVLSIAHVAAEREIIPLVMINMPRRYPQVGGPNQAGLVDYFETYYLPDKQSSRNPLTEASVKTYRSAIRAFMRFRPIAPVSKINQSVLRQFRTWLRSRDMNRKAAGNRVFVVAAVVKHARPERVFEEVEELEPAADVTRTLAYVYEKHYLPAKQKIQSQKTTWKYLRVFEAYGRHLGHVAGLDDLTDEKVGAFMRARRAHGNKATSVNGYRSKLIALWNWCAKKRFVEDFPTIEQIPEPALMPTAWLEEEMVALIKGCESMPGTVAGIPSPIWWRLLHLVAWDCGERTGAILDLRWDMLDMKTGNLVVPAEFRKGGRKPMYYQLRPETLRELRQIVEPEREVIFAFDRDRTMYFTRYRRLLKFAGLPYVPWKSGLQKVRRSFATHLEAAGGNATEALAHSERSVTKNSYLDVRLIERTHPNELLFSLTK